MKRASLGLLCSLWFLPLFVHAQGAKTLEQVLANMDEVAKTFRSAQTDIERTHVTILVNDKDVASGKFYYTRAGKEPRVKMELTKPIAQYALIDKGKLQLYTPNLKQVQEASLGQHKDLLEMFMALGFGQSAQDLKKNFDVTLGGEETLDGKKTTVLDLKPKQAGIKSVQMWMDQQRWVATQLKVTENTGDYFLIKYSNIKLNGSIPESTFQLKLPRDVTVQKL
jgi:outer membrane lipoprotein-sorting protein